MKKLIILGVIVLAIIALFLRINSKQSNKQSTEQLVIEQTYNISKEYLALRYRTDRVLVEAQSFGGYDSWKAELSDIISGWKNLEESALILENSADTMSTEDDVAFNIIPQALAYDKTEISNVFDKAPAGKKIKTLAKFLGVDAKKAYLILTQDQNQVTADAWNGEGDLFKKLENQATVIKDASKIAIFVGSVAATGGAAGFAGSSVLSQTAVVVSGADLTLEVTDDAANIALGDKNKISNFTSSLRTVTEPVATILAISSIPGSLVKNIDKFSTVSLVLDQAKSAAQDGKVIGIQLPAYTQNKDRAPVKLVTLEKAEVDTWLKEIGAGNAGMTPEEIETILGIISMKQEKIEETIVDEEVSTSTDVTIDYNPLAIVSPEGSSFTPQSGLSFTAELNNPEAFMVDGKNVPVWDHWKFYFDDVLFKEKIGPTTITADSSNISGYGTTVLKDKKGKLRVEFSLERMTKSKYSDEDSVQTLIKTERRYIVK